MKFKEYLTEKTSKKEFDTALKNRKINAGCEFEFYLDEDKRGGFFIDTREIEKLIKASDREIQNVDNNTQNYYDAQNDAQDEYNKAKEQISDLEDKIYDLEDKLYDLESEQMNIDDSDSNIQDEIDDIQSEIDDIRGEISDAEEIIQDMDDGRTYDDLWQRFEPGGTLNQLWSFKELMDHMEEYGFYSSKSDKEINGELFSIFEYGNELDDTNNLWKELFGYYFDDFLEDIENGEGGTQVPDEDYIINDLDYPCDTDSTWDIKEDGSLGPGGIEIATGIEQVGDLIDIIEDSFNWIDDVGYTNKDCGFHVHMSMETKKEIDPLKLLLFMEEDRIYKDFEERIGNGYAQGIKKGHFDKLSPFNKDDIITLMKKKKLDKAMNTEKYMGIHLIDLEDNHVEFRYMGGTNYHKKFKEVKEVIGNYAHWLSIACDPDYKKKEYILKVNRMVNHFNYLYTFTYLKTFTHLVHNFPMLELNVSLARWKKMIEIELKPFRQSLKTLSKPKSGAKNINKDIKTTAMIKAYDDFKSFLKRRFEYNGKIQPTKLSDIK